MVSRADPAHQIAVEAFSEAYMLRMIVRFSHEKGKVACSSKRDLLGCPVAMAKTGTFFSLVEFRRGALTPKKEEKKEQPTGQHTNSNMKPFMFHDSNLGQATPKLTPAG